jgi:hypothetical protein
VKVRKDWLLVVEDEPADVELVLRSLQQGNFEASADVAQTEQEFTERLRNRSFGTSTPNGIVGFKTSQGRRDGGAEAP